METDAKNDNGKVPPIYIISGGRGFSANSIVQGALVQFPENGIQVKILPNVVNRESLEKGLDEVMASGGIVVHTMVDTQMREMLIRECMQRGITEFDLMGNFMAYLSGVLKQESLNEPGLYHKMNLEYYDRIEAIEYTMACDDGLNLKSIRDADIVLTGISRTGKTPTSIYLAMLGWKVTNIPLVYGMEPPADLFQVDPGRVFGLDVSINRLLSYRKKRLSDFGVAGSTNYIDPRALRRELDYAQSIFRKGGFQVVNVTNKSIESVANEIIGVLSSRFHGQSRKSR